MSFLKDMAAFMLARKEVLARSGAGADDHFRRPDRADQGLGGRAVHLHLILMTIALGYLGVLSRQRCRDRARRRDRCGRAGRALHPQEA